MGTPIKLDRLAMLLEEHYPKVPKPASKDPFALILWEQVAYLAKDEVRQKAFTVLKEDVGLNPQAITKASLSKLTSIARVGGSIAVKERAQRMKQSAVLAVSLKDLGSLPLAEARKRLLKFPMIGKPGADKILMLSGLCDVFALESNGLRVLLRIGFGKEGANYDASYGAVMEAIAPGLPPANLDRIALHTRLRQHGLSLCKQTKPACERCSIRPYCRFGSRT